MKNKSNHIFWIIFVSLSVLVIFLPDKIPSQIIYPKIKNLAPINDFQKEGNPKMESVLYRLMKAYFTQGLEEAQKFAMQRNIDMEGDSVRVVAEARVTGVAERDKMIINIVNKQIELLGGKVETVYRQLIQCIIPIYALKNFTDYASIKYLRLPKRPIHCVVSEGVKKTGAGLWQSITPYRTTRRAKVCILDLGFKGYKSLLGKELPAKVKTRSFRHDGNLLYMYKHGTACAEIVHDMAPNAKLWLVNFDTDVEHHNAVKWIINEGIDIISYSIAWFNMGAGDGTGPICEDVKRASSNGIIWISAAGNEAQNHWQGNFVDSDGDKRHNFSGVDEILSFYVKAYTPVAADLNWNDWGKWNGTWYKGSNQDYDLYLYYWNGRRWLYVDASTNYQTGWQWPVESIWGWYSSVSTYWGVSIRKYNATKNVKLELFIYGNSGAIEYNHPYGSLTIPADAPYTIAVGATDWSNDLYHTYSSRGPTSDNRIKPDLSAPSGVSSFTYGHLGFFGTSAATPHVAGAFALLKEKVPFKLKNIQTIIKARAKDLGKAGKDNKYGLGRLNLSK